MKFLSGQKWFSWTRLTCLVLTFAILFFVFRNLDTGAFLASLRRMDVRWFILAFLAYGFALWTASIRWHLALHLIHRAVHITATSRLFLVGHFFFAILFGAAGGDLAKSAVYAKWFRFALPEVIASSPLDRVFGLGGTILLATSMALVSVWNGGFANIRNLNIQWAGPWSLVVLGLIIVAGIGLLVWRPQGDGSWARILRAFRYGSGRMLVKPGVALPGLAFALISQTALTSVFAFNLCAVTQSPLPWAQLLWTFPAITIFSCMPFTVAGAGAREVAALTFLGLFGVPAGDCVAASLMTLVQKLAWAGIGGAVFFREDAVYARHLGEPLPKTISVIIPVINEAAALPKTVQLVRANPEVTEIIVVDGGSRDTTREVAGQLGCRVLTSPPGRGGQLRAGAMQATGDVVLMLHADTWLPPDAGQAALNCLRDPKVVAGGFWKVFHDTPLLLLGSRWKCAMRLMVGRRIAGDQSIFVRREVLEKIGGVPDMPLMEEFELCRRLRKVGHLALADATIVTSARRFVKLGVIRTYLRMWRITTLYRLGTPAHELRRIYEKE